MRIVDIEDAKARLSQLVDEAAGGDAFIIAVSGKPVVRVQAVDRLASIKGRRLGFLAGQIDVPADFDTMGQEEIERLFYGEE